MAEDPTRKLAVLLHADVVGSTALVQLNETLAHQRIQDTFRRFSEAITAHSGTAHEIRGDALVAEFSRASDAVSASTAFQIANTSHNQELSDEVRPVVRIGIAMGEVVIADNTITGEGVVLAQRLEQLADPGGVCIQGATYETLPKRLPFDYQYLGERQLKGFDEPVRVYAVRLRPGASMPKPETQAQSDAISPKLPDKPSIAVLPFTNMSTNPEHEYFSDGITEDIITALSRLRSFFVIARNTMFTYKSKSIDARTVAADLGVRYVLEGSVRMFGERVRVTTQLNDASTGEQLWGERYDRELLDVFAIQDEIAAGVVGRLEPELYAAEYARLQRKTPDSLDAWECFVQAMSLISQHSEEGSRAALGLLDQAIELDAEYGSAYALKAYTFIWRAFQSWEDMRAAIEQATAATTRAIACDSQDPWAYVARGLVAMAARDDSEATKAFRHALDLSPNFAYAHALLGAEHAFGGRPDEAVACTDNAIKLSPRDTFSDDFQLYYSFAHFQAERYVEAASYAEEAIQLRPEHPNSHIMAAASHALAGNQKKAADALAQLKTLLPELTASDVEQTWPYVFAEDRARLTEGLRKAGMLN